MELVDEAGDVEEREDSEDLLEVFGGNLLHLEALGDDVFVGAAVRC